MDKYDFKDKVVVITGASAGLGRAIAHEFAKKGAKVALLARGMDGLEGAAREVKELGGEAIAIPTDISNAMAVENAAQITEEKFGPIDIWVNNAMVSVFAPFTEIEPADFKQVTEVTYLGQVYGTLSALKRMKERNRGTIVLVGSALAYRGIPLQSAYCGAKHGIHGFFESVRAELKHDNSRVKLMMVQMPAMNTTQFGFVKNKLPNHPRPMGTIYEPEVAARAILHSIQADKREMYVGFSTVETILGNSIVPGYLDHFLGKTGYKGQQTNKPKEENKPDNLWSPIPGDHGTHGSFSGISKKRSPQVWVDEHKWVAGAVLGGFAFCALLLAASTMK